MSLQVNANIILDDDPSAWVTLADGSHQMYPAFVALRAKDMGSPVLDLHHAATGISGEAGEFLDCSKKQWVYGKPLDMANAIEELGDIEFYLAHARMTLGVTRAQVLQANADKLETRYPTGYSDAAAIARADKEKEVTGDYYKGVKGGTPVAINLPTAAIAGTDDMASIETSEREALSPEAKAELDSLEPTQELAGSGNLPDQPLP